MRKLTVMALSASAMAVAVFGMNASAATKLNLSVPDAASSSIGVAAQEFADQLNEKSDGELEVKVYFDGSLYGGDATAAVTTMQDGGLDMLCLSTSWYSSFDDSFNVISVPFLFDTVDEEQAYLNDKTARIQLKIFSCNTALFSFSLSDCFRATASMNPCFHCYFCSPLLLSPA